MSKTLQKKIRSESGASVVMALLLFLVCSVVGALVLTAATAAAGRSAKLAESDQRYYSVASAAELLSKEIDGCTVRIVRSKTVTTTNASIFTVTPGGISEDIQPEEKSTVYNASAGTVNSVSDIEFSSNSVDSSSMSLLTALTSRLIFPDGNSDTNNMMDYSFPGISSAFEQNISLSAGSVPAGVDASLLKVKTVFAAQTNGTIIVTLSNVNTSGSDKFQLLLTLKPSIKETRVSDPKQESSNVTERSYGYDKTDVSVQSSHIIDDITWSVVSIR